MKKAFKKRKSNHATFMYIPENESKIVSLRIPRWLPKAALFTLILLLIGTASLIYMLKSINDDYYKSNEEIARLAALNDSQKQEIQKLHDDSLKIKLQLEENIKTLEHIKEIVGIKKTSSIQEQKEDVKALAASSSNHTSDNTLQQIYQVQTSYAELSKEVLSQKVIIESSVASLKKQSAYLNAKPSITPVDTSITAGFGYRKNPFTNRGSEFHKGIDFGGETGMDVRATADGVVLFAGWQAGYGKVIIISHGYGLTTLYGHNSKLLVQKGDKVKKAQVICKMGSTGRSTGVHVHYEVRVNGKIVNPAKYF